MFVLSVPDKMKTFLRCHNLLVVQVFLDPGDCEDHHPLCSSWAVSGACKDNAKYMEGGDSNLGMCRLSCGTCTVCAPNDMACRSQNRVHAGYLPVEDL